NRDVSSHNDWKVQGSQLAQDPGKRCVGQFLQADERVENPVEVEIGVGLIHDAYVCNLLPRAAVFELRFSSSVWPRVGMQRIERPFRLKKQRIISQSGCAESRRLQGGFYAAQQTLEFGEEVLMLLPSAVDTLPSRQVEEVSLR